MKIKDLQETHEKYDENIDDWIFYSLAYEGGKNFIEEAITQNPRESHANYQSRLNDAVNFNFAQSIIDLYNFYLVEKDPIRDLYTLTEDTQWQMFTKDTDLYGTNYNVILNESQKLSSIFGSVGFLVDKHNNPNVRSVADEIRLGIYPYLSVYTLPNILDWRFGRNKFTGRPELQYLKLKGENNIYYLWWPGRWEKWTYDSEKDQMAIQIDANVNPLGEIPFIWMPNLTRLSNPFIGISDLVDISRIVASICRNISSGEEVIKYAGFPIMRKPFLEEGEESEDVTGVRSIEEFPPDNPDAKPDWMESVVLEPIEAILKWVDRKTDEIYRVAHLSGVHGQRKSNNEVASGLALRYEFQQLTSVLSKKANNMNEAEQKIIYYWLKWQKKEHLFDEVKIKRSKNFSVDDLSIQLDNLIKSMEQVISSTFKKRIQQAIAKQALPDIPEADKKLIHDEIETSVQEPATVEE